eukprot:CAMPEP_0114514976 /NCGR_PEP_ID=MMETSP0109-20121206/16457_1 /TAXON_ID=29199 /ORGANISM="Chlorarachnion reptans, Strain CCCM449" /LENGTH=173 /DNA_ID=CAMNT_0001695085 /DNA_START=175 /DNA_END=696 /DNA_ORIENTATION=-
MAESKLALRAAFKKVNDQKDPLNWVVIRAPDGKVVMDGCGTGLKTMMQAFKNEEMQWGLIGVLGVDDGSSVKSIRSKLVQIHWCGSSVHEADRGKLIKTQRPAIQKFAGAIACEVATSDPEEITSRKLAYKLFHAQGAHKPTYYDFGNEKVDCKGLSTTDDDGEEDDEDEDFA